jgi:hypothetical protein|tara:strand:+ start:1042 stop:3126 length:2085 start_codon:yes stop_codon:yes gene_type:complete
MATEEQNLSVFSKAAKTFSDATDSFKAGIAKREEEDKEKKPSEVGKAISDSLNTNFASSFLAPIKSIKSSIKNMPGSKIFGAMAKSITQQGKLALATGKNNKAAAQEDKDEKGRQDKRQFKVIFSLGVMVKAILGTLNKMLKAILEGAGKGLGALAGLLFAPIAFFRGLLSGLLDSIKKLSKLVPIKTLRRAFTALGRALRAITRFATRGLSEKIIRAATKSVGAVGRGLKELGKPFTKAWNNFRAGFKNVGKTMGAVKTPVAVKEFKTISGRLGATLGKVRNFVTSTFGKKSGFANIGDKFDKFKKSIKSNWKKVKLVLDPMIKTFKATFGTIKAFAFGLGRFLGRLLWPITLLIALFDTYKGAKEGAKEGGIMGGIQGGLTGLINSLIAAPLDLLKKGVAWILGKLGFDKESEALKSFSFKQFFTDLIGGIFGFIKKAVAWVKLLFKDPVAALKSLWTGLLDTIMKGAKGIMDIIWFPINKAINWVLEKFGWKKKGDPEFNLFDEIVATIKKVKDWVTGFVSRMYDLILKKLKGIKDTALNFVGLGDKDPKDMSKEELAEYNKEKAEDRVKAAKRANKRIIMNRRMRQRKGYGFEGISGNRDFQWAINRAKTASDKAQKKVTDTDGKSAREKESDLRRAKRAKERLEVLQQRQARENASLAQNQSIINQQGAGSTQVITRKIHSETPLSLKK